MKRLLSHYADAPANGKWKGFLCPFCQKKKASVFEAKPGVELFKCFRTSCPSATSGDGEAVNEVGYVSLKENLSNATGGPAYVQYLKIAGVAVEKSASHTTDHEVYHSTHRERDVAPRETTKPSKANKESETLLREEGLPHGELKNESDTSPSAKDRPVTPSPTDDKVISFPGHSDSNAASPGAIKPSPGGAASGGQEVRGQVVGDEEQKSGGDGDGGGDDDDDDDGGAGGGTHRNILRAFYDRLVLSDDDKAGLLSKRGLTAEVCEQYGLRSNTRSNREILMELANQFAVTDLVATGLWEAVDHRDKGVLGELARPCKQFHGWGCTGKDDQGRDLWGWCEPILIPYFDPDGNLLKIRPHRRGVGSPRLYVPRDGTGAKESHRKIVFVEGEFKAMALASALGLTNDSSWGVAGLPGITMVKFWLIGEECKELIDVTGATVAAVVFDNEEKGDPSLPGFKADPQKRFDAEIWARYTAQFLGRGIVTGKVGHLPNEWRDASGKADWDGALAQFRKDGKAFKAAFQRVLDGAMTTKRSEQMGLFASEEERIIRNRLEQLWYEPMLPHGDDKELKHAKRLRKMARGFRQNQMTVPSYQAAELAEDYSKIVGWYFTLKPLPDKLLTMVRQELRVALQKDNVELANFLRIRLDGKPTPVGDFKAKCYFVLVKLDGTRERLVKLRNAQGEETKLVTLPARPFTGPRDFREWLGNQGNFTWMAGERELQALQRDMNHEAAFREVYQVEAYGWHADSRLWFSKNLAVGPDGQWIRPDDMNVFWWDGLGYVVTEKAKDNQDFRQGAPDWHPDIKGVKTADGINFEASAEADPAALRDFLQAMMSRLMETIGVGEAFMAVASALSFAAAPEILEKFYGFPGLWVHGEMRSGKSTIVDWLMEFYGFHKRGQGISLKNSTAVGVQIGLEQYSNLPVWLEEYMETIDDKLKNVVHATTYREPPSKWDPSGTPRRIRTAVFVSGENTATRAATRSRFPHVQVSLSKRARQADGTRLNHFEWMSDHRHLFFMFGREVLTQRAFFVDKCLQCLHDWNSSAEMKKIDDRPRLVHGIVYASFVALSSLFGCYGNELEREEFKFFLIKECVRESRTAAEQVNANKVWETLVNAFERGYFGNTKSEVKRYFRIKHREVLHPPGVADHDPGILCPHCRLGGWKSYTLLMEPLAIIDVLKSYTRQMGEVLPLTRQDFMAQMSDKAYWEPAGKLSQRFGKGEGTKRCWGIALDRHEMGYQPTLGEDLASTFEEYRQESDSMLVGSEDFSDPRKGPLFNIVSVLERNE